jgi:hypothetical protein
VYVHMIWPDGRTTIYESTLVGNVLTAEELLFLATIVIFLARTFAVHGTEVDVGDGTHYWHGLSIQVDEHCMRWQQQTYPPDPGSG